MRLIEANSQGFVEKGSFRLPDIKPSLGATMPVIAGGHLYVRDDDRLLCYDVRHTKSKGSIATAEKIQLAVPTARTPDQLREVRSVFVPTPEAVVTKMLELAKVKPSDVVYDLGSGDGRIVIAAARQYGCRALGYEIDSNLVRLSRAAVQEADMEKLVTIHQRDMLTADLQEADVVTLYLVPDQLAALLPPLQKLKPGARVVSHQFEIPGIEPGKATEVDSNSLGEQHSVYLWTAPLRLVK